MVRFVRGDRRFESLICSRFDTKETLTYLMIALCCFQFKNSALNSFLGWCVLTDERHLRFEISRVIQQFLRIVFPVELIIVNSDLTVFGLKFLKLNIFTSFCVHFNRFFKQLKFSSPVSFNCHRSLFRSLS